MTSNRLGAKVRAAELPLKQIQRAIRVRRLYFPDHPNVLQAVQQAHETLSRFLAGHGSLEVELSPRGVFFAGVRLVMESAQSSDLGRLLSSEGVQILAFEKGLALEEVSGFVEAIATAPTGEIDEDEAQFGDDLLSALWRLDFRNIHYKVQDLLSPASLDGALEDDALGAVAGRIKSLSHELAGGPDLDLPPSDFLAQLDALRESGELDDVVDWETHEMLARDPATQSPERAKLVRGLIEHDALLDRAVDCLTWACMEEGELEEDPDLTHACFPRAPDVVRFFAGAASHLLVRGNLSDAGSLVERTLLLDCEERRVARPVQKELGSERGIKRFLRALERNAKSVDEASTREYLTRLGQAPLRALCEAYPTVKNAEARSLVDSYLRTFAKTFPDPIASLTRHRDPEIVRSGVALLSAAGVGTRAFGILEEAGADAENEVRAGLAKQAIDELTGERERRELLQIIATGREPEARLSALDRLLEIHAPSSFAPLAEVLRSAGFAERESDERKRTLEAITAIGGLRAVGVLQELGARKTWLFRRSGTQALRREAISELDRLKRA